jgi:hypothetical protein
MADKSNDKVSKSTATNKKLGRGLGVAPDEPVCPVCLDLGFREKLHEVVGLEEVSKNPQVEKGAPRVVDCSAGCRYSLEPFYNPTSDGRFCYMLVRSERDPEAVVNHYWFPPEWIEKAKK